MTEEVTALLNRLMQSESPLLMLDQERTDPNQTEALIKLSEVMAELIAKLVRIKTYTDCRLRGWTAEEAFQYAQKNKLNLVRNFRRQIYG